MRDLTRTLLIWASLRQIKCMPGKPSIYNTELKLR